MGDAETTVPAVPADLTLSAEQLDDFAYLLATCLGRGNTTWLAQEAGGTDTLQQAGNEVDDIYVYARSIVGALQDAGRISEAVRAVLRRVDRNGLMSFGLRRILNGQRVNEANLQAFVNEFQPFISSVKMMELVERVGRAVCAVALGKPYNEIRGSGFLIAPDVVITNFHVLEPFLKIDLITKDVRPNADGDQIFFFFDYMNKPEPAVPPSERNASVCVTAARDWMLQARVYLTGDGGVPSPTKVTNEYDYVAVKLARPIGEQSHRRSGSPIRGWLPTETNIDVLNAKRKIIVFQHPQKLPQLLDWGEYVQLDPSGSRVWYTVSTAKGSSGGAAVDIEGRLFALHNAEVKATVAGLNGQRVNQGVRIDKISADLATVVPRREVPNEEKTFFWSLSDDLKNSQPIIGRKAFREAVTQMSAPDSERALVVNGPPESGLHFSIKLLRHTVGSIPVVVFTPQQLQSMTPKVFLRHLVDNLGIIVRHENPIPELQSTESLPRWLRVDLPQWLLESLTRDQAMNQTKYPTWVVINTVVPKDVPFLWAENLQDLIAALLGVHDSDNSGTDLPQLRWLFLLKDADANSNPVPLPLGGVKYLRDDLSAETNYETDYVECMLRAWRANNKRPSMDEQFLRILAQVILGQNQPGVAVVVRPPRKALALQVSEMVRKDILSGSGGA